MANKHLLNGTIKSEPKQWTDEETERLFTLKSSGISLYNIGKILQRTEESCKRRYLRKRKKDDKYNVNHRKLKYEYNKQFLKKVTGESLLDAFSGGVSWWKENTEINVIDNDIKIEGADYKLDAIDFLFQHRKKQFDIVDLDPFGSAYDCFDLALQIAQKGLIITFGEICGKRFNRMDFVEHRYGMNYIEDFTTEKLSEYIVKRGLIYRKILTPIIKAEMTNISRVYYKIEHFDYGNSGCKYFPKKETINLFS